MFLPETDYNVALKTSIKQGSGADVKVYLQLFGVNGQSDELNLSLTGGRFKTGDYDELSFKNMPYLGDLTNLKIRIVKAGKVKYESLCRHPLLQIEVWWIYYRPNSYVSVR